MEDKTVFKVRKDSPIDRAPMRITWYLCLKCGKGHRKGSKVFDEHYSSTFGPSGEYLG